MGILKPNVATGLAAALGVALLSINKWPKLKNIWCFLFYGYPRFSSFFIAQGVIWANMALICIVMYNAHPYHVEDSVRPKRQLSPLSDDRAEGKSITIPTGYLIWEYVIEPSKPGHENKYSPTFNGSLFDAFAWIHFILHAIWLIVSVCILTKMGEKKRMAQIWCIITAIVFLWDFVTSCIIMDDHRRCVKPAKEAYDEATKHGTLSSKLQEAVDEAYSLEKKICNKRMLTVLTITSKIFFLLWILNVFLAYELWTSYGPKIDILQH